MLLRVERLADDIQGLDKSPIYDVSISNSTFGVVESKSVIKNVKGLKLQNVTVDGKKVEAL